MYQYGVAYKPFGVLSIHHTDAHGRQTLTSLGIPVHMHPAGRLDLDSEGLLVLTDDGQTLHRLTHPDHSHAKTYFVQVIGQPDQDAVRRLREGVEIALGKTQPADVEVLAVPPPLPETSAPVPSPHKTSWLRIVLREGMNRQIKRMTAAVGHPTVRLVRVAMGRLTLPPDLMPGRWREMNAVERHVLLADVWPHGRPGSRTAHRPQTWRHL
jgi:23S rRNA pseudouridine2457 synthase